MSTLIRTYREYLTVSSNIGGLSIATYIVAVSITFLGLLANIETLLTLVELSVTDIQQWSFFGPVALIAGFSTHFLLVTAARDSFHQQRFTTYRGIMSIWLAQVMLVLMVVIGLRLVIRNPLQLPLVPTAGLDMLFSGLWAGSLSLMLGYNSYRTISKNPGRTEVAAAVNSTRRRFTDNFQETVAEDFDRIQRGETEESLSHLETGEDVVLLGSGGVGKSGIMAAAVMQWDSPVLAIDARELGGVTTKESLHKHLELPLPPDEALELLAQESAPLIAVDQLDMLPEGDQRKLLERLLDAATETDRVRVLLTARTRDYEHEPFFKRLRERHDFHEVSVTELDESEVQVALEEIGVYDPSTELQFLCQRILNLDIVARLAAEGADLSGIESRVELWQTFQDEIVKRGTAELTDEDAPKIITKAQDLAIKAYENENRTEVLIDVFEPEMEVLAGWDILEPRGGNFYRFGHPIYQEYFFALDAVKNRRWEKPSRLLENVPRSSHVPVVEWMIDLQLEAEDQHRFDDFLQCWLTGESILARTRLGMIEHLTTISPDRIPDPAREILYDQLAARREYHQTFYEELGSFRTVIGAGGEVLRAELSPDWLKQLLDDRQFTTLSDRQQEFLQVHSPDYPELVGRALKQFVPDDMETLQHGFRVLSAVSLPNLDEVRLVEEWLASVSEENRIPSELLRVFQQLVTRNDSEQAAVLLRLIASRALQIYPDGVGTSNIDIYSHQEAIRELAEQAPNQVAPQLREAITEDLDRERSRQSSVMESVDEEALNRAISSIWDLERPPSEASLPISHPREKEGFRTIYLLCYREALLEWVEQDPADPDLERELKRLMTSDIAQFNWVAASVLPSIAERFPEFVGELLAQPQLYRFPSCYEALVQVWKEGFEYLENPDRSNVVVFLQNEAVIALNDARNNNASEDAIRELYQAIDEQVISTAPDAFEKFRKNRPSPEAFSDQIGPTDNVPSPRDLSMASDLVTRAVEVDERLGSEAGWIADEQEEFASNLAEVVADNLVANATKLDAFADIDPIYFEAIVEQLLSDLTAEPERLKEDAAAQTFETCISIAGPTGPGPEVRYHATRLIVTLLERCPDSMVELHRSRIIQLLSNALTPPWDEFKTYLSEDDWLAVPRTQIPSLNTFNPVGTTPACATAGVIYLAETTEYPDSDRILELLEKALQIDDESVADVSGRLLWRVADTEPSLIDPLRDAFLTPQDSDNWTPAAMEGWLTQPVLDNDDDSLQRAFREVYPELSEIYERYTSLVIEKHRQHSNSDTGETSLRNRLENIGDHLFNAWEVSLDHLPPRECPLKTIISACLNSDQPDITVYVLPQPQDLADITHEHDGRQHELLDQWRWHADKYVRPPTTDFLSPLSEYLRWARYDTTLSLSQIADPLRETFPTISALPGDWDETEQLLKQHLESEPLLVIDLYHELLQHGVPDDLQRPGYSIIETTASQHMGDRREKINDMVDILIEAGYTDSREAIDDEERFDN